MFKVGDKVTHKKAYLINPFDPITSGVVTYANATHMRLDNKDFLWCQSNFDLVKEEQVLTKIEVGKKYTKSPASRSKYYEVLYITDNLVLFRNEIKNPGVFDLSWMQEKCTEFKEPPKKVKKSVWAFVYKASSGHFLSVQYNSKFDADSRVEEFIRAGYVILKEPFEISWEEEE